MGQTTEPTTVDDSSFDAENLFVLLQKANIADEMRNSVITTNMWANSNTPTGFAAAIRNVSSRLKSLTTSALKDHRRANPSL